MNKLCLKVMVGELTEVLFLKVLIFIILTLEVGLGLVSFLIIINILFTVLRSLRLYFILKKMPNDIQAIIDENINRPIFFFWRTYILFEDCIINLYKPGYVKIRDIGKLAVNADFVGRGGFRCFLHITTKNGESIKLLHKVESRLYFKCYEDIIPYLLTKNPDIEVIDNFWHLNTESNNSS